MPFTKFVRQVRTDPISVLSTDVAALQAELLLKAAAWVDVTAQDSSFPARNALQDGFEENWDAFKFCGNYAAGYQRAYAGMVAYRFTVPADALTGPDHVVSVDVPLYVDRWLVDGARVAAYLSASPYPSEDWDTLREGDIYADAELPMTYTPPDRIVVEKNDTITLTLPASTDALQYLYVVISLEDYTSTRGFWIEGAALAVGDGIATTFDADVTEDTAPDTRVKADGKYAVYGTPVTYSDTAIQVRVQLPSAVTLPQGIASYPHIGAQTNTQFAGGTGCIVGVTADPYVYGALAVRYVGMSAEETFTKVSFGDATPLNSAGKTVRFLMSIWAGDATVLPATSYTQNFPTYTITGYTQWQLFRGSSPITMDNSYGAPNPAVANTAWPLSLVGQHILEGRDYTSADLFDIQLAGPGIKVVVVAIAPIAYWGTVGAGTQATFKPGASLYLS
jgi:hypothetical protein